jgi:hypothetical protein
MAKTSRALITALLLVPLFASAANVHVRPGSSGSGASWSDALGSLPATLKRGDTYYLASGNYGRYTFDDPVSGTTPIIIKKATSEDHGSDVGWNSSYGEGQAVFGEITVLTGYYIIDGQRRNADWWKGATSQYGIKIKASGGRAVRLDNGGSSGANNVTFRYVDIEGNGRDTGIGDDAIYGLAGNSNMTFEYCAIHDTDRTLFLMRGNWRNLVVNSCYLARNTSTDAIHGELLSSTDVTNMTFVNNVIEDIEGTAVWAGLNNGTWSGVLIQGNVITHTPTYRTGRNMRAGSGSGVAAVVYVANDSSNRNSANNVKFYNNTLVNVRGLWGGVHIESGSGNESRGNIWYNSPRLGTAGVSVHSSNWYYNTQQDGDNSSSKVVCSSNCDIFVSIADKDYRLKAPLPGERLETPYMSDAFGSVRGSDGTWDRGAFEFGGKSAAVSVPKAPSLSVE